MIRVPFAVGQGKVLTVNTQKDVTMEKESVSVELNLMMEK